MDIFDASIKGNFESVKDSIQSGTPVNDMRDYGWAPLHIASFFGHFNVVKLLIENHADINQIDLRDKTPLERAESFANIQFLFQKYRHLLNEEERRILQEKTYRCYFTKKII